MPHTFSLAYLTAAPLTPPEAIRLAEKLGYAAVGLRVTPAAPGGAFSPLIEDKALLEETRAALRGTGVGVFDIEIIRIGADFVPEAHRAFLDVCGALDGKAILVAGDDPDEARLTARFARFCELAAPSGLTANLEFMPWTAVKDAKSALRVVEAAGQPNGRVLVDALHAARSATTLADLAAIPAGRLAYAQICDAPAGIPATEAELIHTARCERLLPGEGGIDLAGIFDALPADLPVSVEIPHDIRKAVLGVEAWSRQALAAARAVLAGVRGRP